MPYLKIRYDLQVTYVYLNKRLSLLFILLTFHIDVNKIAVLSWTQKRLELTQDCLSIAFWAFVKIHFSIH